MGKLVQTKFLFGIGAVLLMATALLLPSLTFDTGIGRTALDIPIHDTYFVVARFHLWLFFGLVLLLFATAYWLYERWSKRQVNRNWGLIHFIATVLPMLTLPGVHLLALPVTPRRYYDYSEFKAFDGAVSFDPMLFFVPPIALFTLGQVAFLVNLIWLAKPPAT